MLCLLESRSTYAQKFSDVPRLFSRGLRALGGLTLFGLALALAACHAPTTPPSTFDWTITASWKYDFTNFPPCSGTITKGCVNGFAWGYVQDSAVTILKTSAVTACSGTTQPESCTDTVNATLGIGTVQYAMYATGLDNSGNATQSVTVNGNSQVIAEGAPTSPSFTAQ